MIPATPDMRVGFGQRARAYPLSNRIFLGFQICLFSFFERSLCEQAAVLCATVAAIVVEAFRLQPRS